MIACSTQNAKFTTTAVSCLQRLSVSRALPKERLSEVLEAFKQSVTSGMGSERIQDPEMLTCLGHDVQLKILQALPSLLQHYPSEIRGDHLSTVLQICSGLQNIKSPAVSNTAAATLQQLIIAVYDRVSVEDGGHASLCRLKCSNFCQGKSLEIPTVTEVKGDDGPVPVRPAANDAYKASTEGKRIAFADSS